jgi:hypothetical protein
MQVGAGRHACKLEHSDGHVPVHQLRGASLSSKCLLHLGCLSLSVSFSLSLSLSRALFFLFCSTRPRTTRSFPRRSPGTNGTAATAFRECAWHRSLDRSLSLSLSLSLFSLILSLCLSLSLLSHSLSFPVSLCFSLDLSYLFLFLSRLTCSSPSCSMFPLYPMGDNRLTLTFGCTVFLRNLGVYDQTDLLCMISRCAYVAVFATFPANLPDNVNWYH